MNILMNYNELLMILNYSCTCTCTCTVKENSVVGPEDRPVILGIENSKKKRIRKKNWKKILKGLHNNQIWKQLQIFYRLRCKCIIIH